jgi:hypothetical protein
MTESNAFQQERLQESFAARMEVYLRSSIKLSDVENSYL